MNDDPRRGVARPRTDPDVLAAIDAVTTCAACGAGLQGSGSLDFCSPGCQADWTHKTVKPDIGFKGNWACARNMVIEHASDPVCVCGCIDTAVTERARDLRLSGASAEDVNQEDIRGQLVEEIREHLDRQQALTSPGGGVMQTEPHATTEIIGRIASTTFPTLTRALKVLSTALRRLRRRLSRDPAADTIAGLSDLIRQVVAAHDDLAERNIAAAQILNRHEHLFKRWAFSVDYAHADDPLRWTVIGITGHDDTYYCVPMWRPSDLAAHLSPQRPTRFTFDARGRIHDRGRSHAACATVTAMARDNVDALAPEAQRRQQFEMAEVDLRYRFRFAPCPDRSACPHREDPL